MTEKQVIKNSLKLLDIATWVILFSSVFILLVNTKHGYSAHDASHPIYELSIGHSFKRNLLNPPDLSYQGRTLRYHFLGTLLPSYFSTIFGVDFLQSAYLYTPLFLLFILFLLIQFFFKKYPQFKTPVLFIFFAPFWVFSGYYSCLFSCSIWVTSSIFLGFIFFIASMIFLMQEKWPWLLASMTLLLLAKASFFMTAGGGIALYLFREQRFREMFAICACLGAIFLSCFFLFFSGAHAHNLWILFPHFVRAAFFDADNRHLFTFVLIVISFLVLLYRYITEQDKHALVLYSLCLSGLLGCFLIAEVCENNGAQFYTAIYFPAALLIWTMGTRSLKSKITLQNLLIVLIFISSCTATIPSLVSHMQRLQQGFQLKTGYSENITREGLSYRWGGTWNTDLVDAYQWLNKNTQPNAVILFSPHYEVEGNWWTPRTGFIRSALSNRQMVLEECWQKAILMEPNYPKRYADILNFYIHATKLSESSQQKIAMLNKCFSESSPGVPLDQDTSKLWRKLMYHLSLHKRWYGHNRLPQVAYEIGKLLNNDYNENDLLHVLDTYSVSHIILENHDQSTVFLRTITKEVYSNKTIIILEKIT